MKYIQIYAGMLTTNTGPFKQQLRSYLEVNLELWNVTVHITNKLCLPVFWRNFNHGAFFSHTLHAYCLLIAHSAES